MCSSEPSPSNPKWPTDSEQASLIKCILGKPFLKFWLAPLLGLVFRLLLFYVFFGLLAACPSLSFLYRRTVLLLT